MNRTRFRINLQFFGDDPEPDKGPPKEPDKTPEPEPETATAKAIRELKKRLAETESRLEKANTKIAEQNEAITALLDGEQPKDRTSDRFWASLRYIKKRG